MGFKTPQH